MYLVAEQQLWSSSRASSPHTLIRVGIRHGRGARKVVSRGHGVVPAQPRGRRHRGGRSLHNASGTTLHEQGHLSIWSASHSLHMFLSCPKEIMLCSLTARMPSRNKHSAQPKMRECPCIHRRPDCACSRSRARTRTSWWRNSPTRSAGRCSGWRARGRGGRPSSPRPEATSTSSKRCSTDERALKWLQPPKRTPH